MEEYKVIVIGGGPGGYESAIRLSQYGISCLVIEKERLGGVCLNRGCIPTKALVKSAELYREMNEAESFGLPSSELKIDYAKVFERKNKIVEQLVGGIEFLYRKRKIALHTAKVNEISKLSDGYAIKTDDDKSYKAQYVIIATGSKVVVA